MKILKILLKYKYVIFIFIMLLSLFRASITKKSVYDIDQTVFKGIVIDFEFKDKYITFILKDKEKIKCNYYFNENEKIDIQYGDIINLTGKLNSANNNTIQNLFNYKKYLQNKNIFYILNVNEIISIKRSNNILYKVKNIIHARINNIDSKGYLNAFILGNKNDINDNVYDGYKNNGILHIFSISGMHISILSATLLFF